MKLFLVLLLSSTLLTGCSVSDPSGVNADVQSADKSSDASGKPVEDPAQQEIAQLKSELSRLTSDQSKLGQKTNNIAREYTNLRHEVESYKAQLILSPPEKLPFYFKIEPEPKVENGWYVLEKPSTIRLNGYTHVAHVQFKAAYMSYSALHIDLGPGEQSSDGWAYQARLPENGDWAFWAVITQTNGDTFTTPVLPVSYQIAPVIEDMPKPDRDLGDLTDPVNVVKQFYALTTADDYQSAWYLIGNKQWMVKVHFLSHQGEKGTDIRTIAKGEVLDSYKSPLTMTTQLKVPTVRVTLVNGEKKVIHLTKTSNNEWRLIWDPDNGLE